MIDTDDYLCFIDEALNGMVEIITEFGDERANQRIAVTGANSAFAILTHCLGVIEYWAGHIVAGRRIERDREAEFRSAGGVDELLERTQRARQQLRVDVGALEPHAPPRGTPRPDVVDLPIGRTQGGALIHVHEELQRHLGQMEVGRDVLLASWARLA